MSALLGLAQKLYRNGGSYGTPTWGVIPIVRDVKVPLEADEADVTTRGNGGWKAIKQALKAMAFEFQIVYDPASADFTALRDAFLNATPLDLWAADGLHSEEGTQGPRAVCELTKFDKNEQLSDAVLIDVVAKPTYSANPPTWHEVPESP